MVLTLDGGRPARTVVHVGKYYPPYEGGIESHVYSLCSGLRSHYDVTALVFNTAPRTVKETVDGVRVIRAPSLGRVLSTEISPSYLAWFARLGRADIIHLHVPNPVGELACLGMPRRARLVVTYHSDVVRQKLLGRASRLILHRVLSRADRVIVFTRRYMESSPVLKHHMPKCAIIPHGIDLEEMRSTPRVESLAAQLRARCGERLVLFVGRLVYYKGVDVLLRAMVQVPGASLAVIGDGPMRRSLEGLSRELGVGGRVHFLGQVPHEEKVAACHAARFLVLPATHRSEAFGVVQVEALAAGLPVISTNIDSGVPFVNQHGVTGLVVEPGDPEALAAAMRRLLDEGDLRAGFADAAFRRAKDLFTRDRMIDEVRGLYERVLERPSTLTRHEGRTGDTLGGRLVKEEAGKPEFRPTPTFELRAPTSGMGLLDPRTALLVWGSGSVVVGLLVTYFLVQGDMRSIVLLLLGVLGLACLAPRRGVYILLTFLPFMYLIRRLVLTFQEFSARDPILLFPAVTAIAMFMGLVIFRRATFFHYVSRSMLLKVVLALMAVYTMAIFNPLQGGLIVGLGGALFFLVPMTWTFFGLLLKREDIERIFRMLVVIGVITALYGLYQHYWGLSSFEIYEMKSKAFLKSFGTRVRIMSTFSSLGDFSLYLALASIISFAFFWRTKTRPIWLVIFALFQFTMVWMAVRSCYLIVFFSILMLLILFGRNTSQLMARGTIALVAVVAIYAGFSLYRPEKLYAQQNNPYVTHTLAGITHPTQERSFQGRLKSWSSVVRTTFWPYPLGRGIGSTTSAAAKFGAEETTVDSYFFELFHATGLLGPPIWLIMVLLSLSMMLRLCIEHPDIHTYKIVLGLTCGVYLGSVFGLVPRDFISGPIAWLLLGWSAREAVDGHEASTAPA